MEKSFQAQYSSELAAGEVTKASLIALPAWVSCGAVSTLAIYIIATSTRYVASVRYCSYGYS